MKKIKGLVCAALLLALVAAPQAALAGSAADISLSRFSVVIGDRQQGQEQEQEQAPADTAPVAAAAGVAVSTGVAPSATGQVAPLYPFVAEHYASTGSWLTGYDLPYVIGVDVTNQVITVAKRGADGRYSAPAKIFLCSTGARNTPTPLGFYYLPDEILNEWVYFPTSRAYVRYPVRIEGNYFFHSLVYNRRDISTRTASSLRNLGSQASAGCIRMLDEDIYWMHQNVDRGCLVVVYEGAADPNLNAALRPQIQKDMQ